MAIEEQGVPWYYDIMKFLELGVYTDNVDKRERRLIRMMVMQYILCGGQLYRRSYDGIHLHFLKEEEGVPWYYDIMKFLELGIYPDSADKKECCLVRMMAM